MAKMLSKDETQALLKEHGLRVTEPRVVILQNLAQASHPLSHSELLDRLGTVSWDSSTTFRTLKKLVEEKLAVIASRIDGIDRYAFGEAGHADHEHAHFVCNDCGEVSCLPESLQPKVKADDPWAQSVKQAQMQLRGECPDCIE